MRGGNCKILRTFTENADTKVHLEFGKLGLFCMLPTIRSLQERQTDYNKEN